MAPTRPTSGSKTPYKDILSAISTGIKKSSSRVNGDAVDLDKCCGVSVAAGSPCPKPLRDCQTHSRVQKRAVAGRSCTYDMLIIPAYVKPSSLHEKVEDNGEGSSTGASKADRKGVNNVYVREWNPQVEIKASKKSPKRKGRAAIEDIETNIIKGEDMDTTEDTKDKKIAPAQTAARAKGKKRGPKAWTALENEVAKDIREYAGHKIPTIEHLEVARNIIEKVRASKQGDNEELPGGSYRVMGWGG
ncbi:hypothetical protein N431DRAFT_526824 [Stipitochalara longipes BDJ]|nr:hypothetical protein N431DRAFT_526824 [Stipitochalara longipes BDJ]